MDAATEHGHGLSGQRADAKAAGVPRYRGRRPARHFPVFDCKGISEAIEKPAEAGSEHDGNLGGAPARPFANPRGRRLDLVES
jgi:hypothetical protein